MKKAEHTAGRQERLIVAFENMWEALFTSPVHLDSLLSKQTPAHKSALARMIQTVLLRPVSQAEALGIGSAPGEPWSLSSEELAHWRTATLMAEKIYESLSGKPVEASFSMEDFPPEMVSEWESAFGKDTARELARALSQDPPLSLRASKAFGASNLLDELTQGSRLPVKAGLSDLSPLGVRLEGYARVMDSEFFEKGAFEIQDEGSQVMALFALWPELFAPILSRKPGPVPSDRKLPELPAKVPALTVVDACAGAGGKSLALADLLGNRGRVFSYDVSERKLQALKRRAKRAGYNSIQTVALPDDESADAKVRSFKKPADLVLVDAPCTGWGVLRRNPDIKWRQEAAARARMPEIQLRLLSRYSYLVRPGGRLVFGVCTFRPEETTAVVSRFLETHPEFQPRQGGYLGPGPCDGFFMQAFERRGP